MGHENSHAENIDMQHTWATVKCQMSNVLNLQHGDSRVILAAHVNSYKKLILWF